jgi:hypothetical protein
MSERYEISPYNIDHLIKLVSEKSGSSLPTINSKFHIIYFNDYFATLGAKTILVENHYIDRDFLDDFTGYYVRCFTSYRRKCSRFHFFDVEFDKNDFSALLRGDTGRVSKDDFQNSYLGFVVIKPLPQTVFGRTCLKTYPSDNDRRHFPVTQDYNPNLFGIPLKIRTLPFQEQDNVVAACATSALWSIFRGTGKLFDHPVKSPVEITNAASVYAPLETRILPNKGLSIYQMTHAIRSVGLEPFLVKGSDEYILKSTLYAYLEGHIPILMGARLFDASDKDKYVGSHAVAIAGYSLGIKKTVPYGPTGFLLKASRIDRIYVHDDQVGPFARMVFDKIQVNTNEGPRKSISTSWKGKDGKIGSIRALPDILLIPLYHKIRIPFDVVHVAIIPFDGVIEQARLNKVVTLPERLEWDIYLTTVNYLKTNILETRCAKDGEYCQEIMLEGMPRFIWRAIGLCGDKPSIELLFDATDIEQGALFIRAIEYDYGLSVVLRTLSNSFKGKPEWKIFQWFETQPLPNIPASCS